MESPKSITKTPIKAPNYGTSDNVVNSLIKELKTITLSNNLDSTGMSSYQQQNSIGGDSSNVNNSNGKNMWGKSSVWGSPQSPSSSSIGTQYYSNISHSNSKESLWASTQSSPTTSQNNNREFLFNSSQMTGLWDNPISKMSQSVLMSNRESTGSVWTTPQSQSPINNNMNKSIFSDSGSPTIFNKMPEQKYLRPNDLANDNMWSSSTASSLIKPKEPVGSLWAAPTNNSTNIMNSSYNNNNNKSVKSLRFSPTPTPIGINPINPINPNNSAASSCLQLFSDEFLSYLNMIN